MKALMLVCDGMADRPVRELKGRTPLEVAKKRNMDALARRGITGILDPIAPGVRVGSDTTHLALLGYDPYEVYTGRGPFEAAGVGLKLRQGDIAFRCNFATVDENWVVLDRRAGRISRGTDELARAINRIKIPGVEIIFKESVSHRGVLILRGKKLSHKVSDSDPHVTGEKVRKVRALDASPEARKTASIVNAFSEKVHKVLRGQPANMLLLRGCGASPRLQPFKEKYGISGACIATTGIIKGIARLAGMEVIEAKQDYSARIKQGLGTLNRYDFLLMNIKEPDEASHDHDAKKKIQLIEEIDKALKPLLEFSKKNYLLLLSDHTTSLAYGDHTGDSVPVVLCGPEARTDYVKKFDERSTAKGGLGRIKGQDLMPLLLDLMNRSEKFGA
ncbi:MAG: 2,3-bisphosphoglycerate-independent phosphoglycerate mutase [Euryarchaeota archaeon]|nr:2,3-bisphosphoglycerate-independent phosphoglycerate mutase [Euryarchaeota archaeon]